MRNNITEEDMMSDLRCIILGIIQRLGYIFDGGKDVIGPDGKQGPWVYAFRVADAEELPENEVDISHLAIASNMRRFYKYACHGIVPHGEHILDFVGNIEDFMESVRGASHMEINNDYGAGSGSCVYIYELGFARWCLDEGEPLTLKQLALLAGLDEGTVRNAASKSGDKKLRTTKTPDGRTLVDTDVAYAWLSTKRGFVPTDWNDSEQESDPNIFDDVAGFIRFTRWKRNALKLSIEEAAKATRIPGFSEKRWVAIENGGATPAVSEFPGLAQAFKVSESWLTGKLMAVFYPRQYAMIKGEISGAEGTQGQ